MTMIDERAAVEPKTRRAWRCPDWCVETDSHEKDSEALDGGTGAAIHRSREWVLFADGQDWSFRLVQETNTDRPDRDVRVWLSDTADQHFSLSDAHHFAMSLIEAVVAAKDAM